MSFGKPRMPAATALQDILAAFSLLTRVPVQQPHGIRWSSSSWAWPIPGIAVGAFGAAVALLMTVAGGGPAIAAMFAIGGMVVLTGAMHEDGLADYADGAFGGRDRTERLQIMKDSRIGAFGAVTLVLFVLGRHAGLADLFASGLIFGPLIAAAATSRAAMVLALWLAPAAKEEGAAASVGSPHGSFVVLAVLLALVAGVTLIGWLAVAASLVSLAAGLAIVWHSRRKLGGITGDGLGAVQQTAELGFLVFLAAAY